MSNYHAFRLAKRDERKQEREKNKREKEKGKEEGEWRGCGNASHCDINCFHHERHEER